MPSHMIRPKGVALSAALALLAFPSSGSAQTPLILDKDGLGGITAATPFDIPTLQDIVPDVVWQRDVRQTEEGAETVFLATRRGKTGFTLYGNVRGRIAAIEIASPRIGNNLGPRVGDSYRTSRQKEQLGSCWPGMESQSGSVVCDAQQSGHVSYLFTGVWNGPDGQMPPASTLDTWTVSKVIWRPERFADVARPGHGSENGPSFDCSKARGSIEEMICRSADLARLDRQLNRAYDASFAAKSPAEQRLLRAEQRGWIKARNDCWKSSDPHRCAAETYRDRIAELSAEKISLPGSTWIGLRIAGDTIPRDINITLTFGEDGRMTGSSGCNRFFATYSLDGRHLRIAKIGWTRRMCAENHMLAEHRFLEALGQVDGWASRNQALILFGTGAELTFQRM